jgi:hypothetical protein
MLRRLLLLALFLALGSLASAADLTLQRLALHDYEDGPLIQPGYEYLPGETVWVGARIAGFSRQVQDAEARLDHVRLSWQMRPADASGALLVPPLRGVIDETLRPEDKEWTPKIMVSFQVPAYLPRGVYRIPFTLRDEVSRAEASGQVEIRVRSQEAPARDATLGVRDFRFLAKEDDRFPLRPAVFRQGAPLFTRFEIIGYTLQGNNHFSVDYGLTILGPPGADGQPRKVLSQEAAAAETGESFYPQRWVPAGFGLNLDPDVPTGAYTLILTLRDKLSGATQEFRDTFEIRE